MNYNLTAEQDMIIRSLRAFREQELEPHEAEVDRTGEVPEELGQRIKQRALEMGFYAPNLPEDIGGGGLDYKTLALFERELGKTSYGLHGYIHRPSEILLACTGDQVEKYLQPCVTGEKKEVFALTEPGAGSDILSMLTNAKRDGDDFIINGAKHFISSPVIPDFAILFAWTGDQVEKYLQPCVTGEKKEVFALTEPGAGSDILSMLTNAKRDGDDFIINGAKHFISSPVIPDFAILFAWTGVKQTKRGERKLVTAFLVDRDTPGFSIERGPRCAAQRAYHTWQLSFDRCRVHQQQILGAEGEGFELADKWLKMGRVWVAAAACGKMERLLELATSYAAERKQFGQAIGKFQGTSFKLADMATDLQAADLLVMHAADKADQGIMEPDDAAKAKLFASEAVGRAADSTIQIYGGMGLMEELPIERLWRDARLDRIWDGTSEIQRHIISRSLLRQYEN